MTAPTDEILIPRDVALLLFELLSSEITSMTVPEIELAISGRAG